MAEELGLPDLVSDVLNTMSCVQQSLGRAWQDSLERALAVALESGADQAVGRAYANLQAMAIASLDFDLAEKAHDDGLEYCEAHDLPTYTNCLVGGQVVVLEATGRYDRAVDLGLGRMAAADLSPVNRLDTHITVGKILARRGDPAAWSHLDTALDDATALDEPQYLVVALLARVEAHWLEGDLDAAVEAVLQAAEMSDQVDGAARGLLNTWLVRLGREPVPGQVGAPYAAQLSGDVAAAVLAWEEAGRSLRRRAGPARRPRRGALARGGDPASTRWAPRRRREWPGAGSVMPVPAGSRPAPAAPPGHTLGA